MTGGRGPKDGADAGGGSRRGFLRAGAAAALAGLAGCGYLGSPADTREGDDGATPEGTPARGPVPGETDLPVSESALRRAADRDGIPAITDPAFGNDWSGVSYEVGGGDRYAPRLDPEDLVVGIATADGRARAYPLKLLRWHEAVNDTFGAGASRSADAAGVDDPLLVTYCPLCRSAVAADRLVGGEPATFGVSGLLWAENLVLYDDRTDSLWSQLLGRAIRGPATGQRWPLRASTLASWREWRGAHPETAVLLPSPRSETVVGRVRPLYGANLYEDSAELLDRAGEGLDNPDPRLPARTLVLGVATDDAAVAYPRGYVTGSEVIKDRVGDRPVVVSATRTGTFAYDRRLDGRPLTFEATATAAGDVLLADGSRWSVATGRALDGPHEGRRLEAVPGTAELYWFAWASFHPGTRVWRP